jgi:hypothetical protein
MYALYNPGSVVPDARVPATPMHKHTAKPAANHIRLASDACCSTGRLIAMPIVAPIDARYAKAKHLSGVVGFAKSSAMPIPLAAVISIPQANTRGLPFRRKPTVSSKPIDTETAILILNRKIVPRMTPVQNAHLFLLAGDPSSAPSHNRSATAKIIHSCGWPTAFASPLKRKPTSKNVATDGVNRRVQLHTTRAISAAITIQTGNTIHRKPSCVTFKTLNRASKALLKKVSGPYIADTWSYRAWPERKSRFAWRKYPSSSHGTNVVNNWPNANIAISQTTTSATTHCQIPTYRPPSAVLLFQVMLASCTSIRTVFGGNPILPISKWQRRPAKLVARDD